MTNITLAGATRSWGMTEDEFQNKYHHFETTDIKEATVEAVKINAVAEGFRVVAVGPMMGKYCLMLESAALFLEELGYD